MGEMQSVLTNWGAENCQQFKKNKLKDRKLKADGMRQKLALE